MINWSGFHPVGDEQDYLMQAFSSGWVSGGAYVADLENALEQEFSACAALAVSNGTAALQLAYQVIGAAAGDEVVVPAFCFQAGANVALQLGLRPRFCDVDPRTWNQSVDTIEHALTDNTAGILVVHNYGRAAPVAEIAEFAESRGLWLIEDCAEAWFSRHRDRYVGQYGQVSTFSMHATKTIAAGEGGVVLVNDPELVDKARLLKSHGLARRDRHYFHLLAGNNYRLSNLLSAVALAQFEQREQILSRQRRHAALYEELLAGHDGLSLQAAESDQSVDELWATGVRIDFDRLSISRDRMIELLADHGIEVRPGFYAASSLDYFSDYIDSRATHADDLAANVLVLPTNANVDEDQVRTVCSAVIEITDSHGRSS